MRPWNANGNKKAKKAMTLLEWTLTAADAGRSLLMGGFIGFILRNDCHVD